MTDRLAGLVMPDKTPIDETRPPAPVEARKKAARKPVRKTPPSNGRRSTSDWLIVASGLALAGLCAIFPWYIFFNQEEFGTRAVTFGKPAATAPADPSTAIPQIVGAREALSDLLPPDLDMEATGTVTSKGTSAVPANDQPFPGSKPNFKLVLVANGRAMVRDDKGYWVVQPGAWLPDGSRVSAIEQREGKWVLVTSREAVVPMAGD